MWYGCKWDDSPLKSQFVKSKQRPKYGLQHRLLAHTKQKAMKGPNMSSVKQENQLFYMQLEKSELFDLKKLEQ